MESELDELQDKLQQMVMAEARKVYSDTVVDHAMNPRNVGEIPDADGYGSALGSCGDSMEIWLRVKGGRIEDARFWTDGCSTTIACGSMVTGLAKGKEVTVAQRITRDDVLSAVGGLPLDDEHCAALAVNVLREAIKDYLIIKREPWRRGYRRR